MFGKKLNNQFANNQFEKCDRKCLVLFGLKLNIEVTSVKYVLNTKKPLPRSPSIHLSQNITRSKTISGALILLQSKQ